MDQWSAVNQVLSAVKSDPAVLAAFLKGSLARGDADAYSDVDFYCLVRPEYLQSFLDRRLLILQSYKSLIYHSESNFVGPQVVAVYEDGLHFDLYTVTDETLARTDSIRVLHDPLGLLKSYQPMPQELSPAQLARHVDEFSFMLLEFSAAFMRDDLIWASRLASHLSGQLSFVMRFVVQRDKSALGMKRLSQLLDTGTRWQFEKAIDSAGPSSLPDGVIRLVDLMRHSLKMLPAETRLWNSTFFEFMAHQAENLSREKVSG